MARERHVFPTGEIPHLWMHAPQRDARNPQGNLFFKGDTIYSYRDSFPMAKRVTNARGQQGVLVSTTRYSVTTSGHQRAVRQAIPANVPSFEVPSIGTWGKEDHAKNLAYFMEEITEHVGKAARARSTWTVKWNLGRANGLVASARGYAKFFGVKLPKLPKVPEPDSERLAELGKREREKSAKRAKESREENERREKQKAEARAKWEAELPGKMERWRAGESVGELNPSWSLYGYDRARIPEVPTMLRVTGDQVETSQGARVPVDHALRALKLVRACVAAGREYVRNGHTEHVGNYPIDRVESNGTLHAGCHVIGIEEIERVAPEVEKRWREMAEKSVA